MSKAKQPIKTPVQEAPQSNPFNYQDISAAPKDGSLIIVSVDAQNKGEIVFWKKTSAYNKKTRRWDPVGFFVNYTTNLRLSYKPKYYRARMNNEI